MTRRQMMTKLFQEMNMNTRPSAHEFAPYFSRYIDLVPEGDILRTLAEQIEVTGTFLNSIDDRKSLYRYREGAWSIREVVGHLSDTERIFCYRLLRFARGDQVELSGFEQDDFVQHANFDHRDWDSLKNELRTVRAASLTLLEGLDDEAWTRSGTASGNPISVRAVPFILAGHELHHRKIIRERYL